MSRGSVIRSIRIPADLAELVDAELSKSFLSYDEPDTFSTWVRRACWDRLKHLDRAKSQTKRKTAARRQSKAGLSGGV